MSFRVLSHSDEENCAKVQEIICDFMVHHQEAKLHQDQIREILRLVRFCSEEYSPPEAFMRQVLKYIAQRMFWSDFNDSEDVSTLITMVFHNDFCISLLLPGADPAISSESHHEYVAYFLRHAYRLKMLLNGYRMPCAPVFDGTSWNHPVQLAACTINVPLLRVFLRYGALFGSDDDNDRSVFRRSYRWNDLELLTWILQSIVDLNPDLLRLEDLSLEPEDCERYLGLLRCCDLILPDLPRWPPRSLDDVCYHGESLGLTGEVQDFVRDFSNRVMPGLDQHFTAPLNLMVACRYLIRKHLNERWLLPSGIDLLPIQDRLKRYIDLEIE